MNQIESVGSPKMFLRLFALPGSKEWKGVQIRAQLCKYMRFYGFGHNRTRRYGEGEPPLGWPVLVEWAKFKGPSKGYSLVLCSEIIFQLLEAQEINPMEYGPEYCKEEIIDFSDEEDDTNELDGSSSKMKRNIRIDQ